MVGDAINRNISKGRGTEGCVIVHGCGMDMGYFVQDTVHSAAFREGFPEMFNANDYDYLGRHKRPF